MPPSRSSFASQLKAAAPFLIGLAFTVAAAIAQRRGWLPDCPTIQRRLAASGGWASVLYVAIATVLPIFFIPRTVALVAGAVGFPFWEAVILITISSQLTAVISFAVARGFGHTYITALAQRQGWIEKLSTFVQKNEISFVVLMRFIHFLPYAAVNYAMGLLPVSPRAYFWGTLVGMIPGTLLFVYLSNTLGCALVDPEAALTLVVKIKLFLVVLVLSLMGVVPLVLSAWKQK